MLKTWKVWGFNITARPKLLLLTKTLLFLIMLVQRVPEEIDLNCRNPIANWYYGWRSSTQVPSIRKK